MWIKVGLEKINTYKGVTVKTLLDSGAMGMFIDKKFVEEQGFKIEKLKRLLKVKNIDGLDNSGRKIKNKVECNMYFEKHMERIRMDVYKLRRMKVILDIPWLVAYNPEVDWEKGEVKMTRCPSWCGRSKKKKERKYGWQRKQ